MKTGLAITCFNSPERCRTLLCDLALLGKLKRRFLWINDQSDNLSVRLEYSDLADEFKIAYCPSQKTGATGAKRQVAEFAKEQGLEFVHQMSEDFRVNDQEYEPYVAPVSTGIKDFLSDSEAILLLRPELDFVKYNIITPPDGDMAYLTTSPWGTLKFEMMKGVTLPFLTGDVVYSNWPACWRVDRILKMWEAADKWTPLTDRDRELVKISGGEWAASMCGFTKGAVLVAQPLIHGRRHHERPDGSLS